MDENAQRLRLIEAVLRLPADRLLAASDSLQKLQDPAPASEPLVLAPHAGNVLLPNIKTDWPHAPRHCLSEHGTYMVTTGTYHKAHIFGDADRLSFLESQLLTLAPKYDWHLEAWAVFSNHYHFVAYTLSTPTMLREFLTELHAVTAREMNVLDREPGRLVWHNFWDKRLTFEKSYLARLNYVHQNAVKHGLVRVANHYRWCSAAWLERTARPAQVKTIYSFKTDQLKVPDEFEPLPILEKS
jgi:putative transposase